ncbi:MAG: RDD family protein [Actinomycetota bacterium]
MSQTPGHYHAEGDPPDTVRYWDGAQWVGDPIPAPPSASAAPPPPPGAPGADTSRFAPLGVRFGAFLIDFALIIVVSIVFAGALFAAEGESAFESSNSGAGILIGLLFYVALLWVVVQYGGTPGKLILGLRITDEDGQTPVGWRGAFMRSLPSLLGNLPIIGIVISLGAAIASIFLINNDPERRSAYDRIGSTRVVRKDAM